MCSQVQRTLDQILSGELDDDRLRDVYVSQVVPAPDAHCLMVSVSPLGFAKDFQPQVVLARLAEHTGRLRSELARAINRKKTPELVFRVVLTEDLPPQSVSDDADDFDVLKLQADINLMLPVGQFQFVETNSGHVLRYYASVSVQGIASDDLEYEGPFQIHPFLYDRLFSIGADCMNRYVESFRTGDIDTVGIKLSDSLIDPDDNSSNSENSWISVDTKPEKEGDYEATIDKVGWPNPMPSVMNAYWNNSKWIDKDGRNVKIKFWRKFG
jgi:ribosome-binding factor A